MQTRRAEALPGFRLASPLHEKETPGEAPGVECIEAQLHSHFQVRLRARASGRTARASVAQPKAARLKLISLLEPGTNRVKIPLCKIRLLQLLQKSLSAIATIPLNIKIVF